MTQVKHTVRFIFSSILVFWVLTAGIARAQYSPAGWVLHVTLTQPFTVPAGTILSRFLESSGQIPSSSYPTLSSIVRAVLFVSAGASATQCQVGVAGGTVTSPPVTVPANSTVELYLEDTGSRTAGSYIQYAGIVVTAGSGGAVTVLPGSTFTETIIPTENAIY
jgi:hypothetical protein